MYLAKGTLGGQSALVSIRETPSTFKRDGEKHDYTALYLQISTADGLSFEGPRLETESGGLCADVDEAYDLYAHYLLATSDPTTYTQM